MGILGIFQCLLRDHKPQQQQGSEKYMIFSGNEENVIKNGETLLVERISLFNGRTNSIRCFSVGDLNSMNVVKDQLLPESSFHKSFRGVWDEKSVMVKIYSDNECSKLGYREIAVATQMGTHGNVHRLLGCCLHTKYPVLVYKWEENGTLRDCILSYKEQNKQAVEWKDRLMIAWEVAHAVAYMHTAFSRPIIHRDLKPWTVFLGEDGAAKLSDFSISISIPEGENHVQDEVIGTWGHLPPEYLASGRVSESTDVFAFGTLLLVLVTGKPAASNSQSEGWFSLVDWVRECCTANCFTDIIDPAITTNGAGAADERHLKETVQLGLLCSAEDEEHRPAMVDVAIQLSNMIKSLTSDSL
ncbi:hypothetical protein KSS87_017354 [Heliosperma pusillum]|nr:hypothetical protein KSS87_017354 [Heliosperma pusillum]